MGPTVSTSHMSSGRGSTLGVRGPQVVVRRVIAIFLPYTQPRVAEHILVEAKRGIYLRTITATVGPTGVWTSWTD